MTYSSSLAMSRQRYATRHQNAVSFQERVRTIGPISNTIILVILTCLLGLLYLTQVTKTNAYGYQLNSLKEAQADLKSEKDELEVAKARLQSLQRVAESEAAKNLVSVAPASTIQN